MKGLFFLFGVPLSGAAVVRQMLHKVSGINCPVEHQFEFFIKRLPGLLEDYNELLKSINSAQDVSGELFTGQDFDFLFKVLVEHTALLSEKDRDSLVGINDNGITHRLKAYMEIFPDARFIEVIRDPRAVTLESWHFNTQTEEGFINRAESLEKWADTVATYWSACVAEALEARNAGQRLEIVSWEELRAEPVQTMSKILQFLGAEHLTEPSSIVGEFMGMLEQSKGDDWSKELGQEAISVLEKKAGPVMAQVGYTALEVETW